MVGGITAAIIGFVIVAGFAYYFFVHKKKDEGAEARWHKATANRKQSMRGGPNSGYGGDNFEMSQAYPPQYGDPPLIGEQAPPEHFPHYVDGALYSATRSSANRPQLNRPTSNPMQLPQAAVGPFAPPQARLSTGVTSDVTSVNPEKRRSVAQQKALDRL